MIARVSRRVFFDLSSAFSPLVSVFDPQPYYCRSRRCIKVKIWVFVQMNCGSEMTTFDHSHCMLISPTKLKQLAGRDWEKPVELQAVSPESLPWVAVT